MKDSARGELNTAIEAASSARHDGLCLRRFVLHNTNYFTGFDHHACQVLRSPLLKSVSARENNTALVPDLCLNYRPTEQYGWIQ